MKPDIHPETYECEIVCDCGSKTTIMATVPGMRVEVCSECHPFYTKKEKVLDTAGRIDRFKNRYGESSLKDKLK